MGWRGHSRGEALGWKGVEQGSYFRPQLLSCHFTFFVLTPAAGRQDKESGDCDRQEQVGQQSHSRGPGGPRGASRCPPDWTGEQPSQKGVGTRGSDLAGDPLAKGGARREGGERGSGSMLAVALRRRRGRAVVRCPSLGDAQGQGELGPPRFTPGTVCTSE